MPIFFFSSMRCDLHYLIPLFGTFSSLTNNRAERYNAIVCSRERTGWRVAFDPFDLLRRPPALSLIRTTATHQVMTRWRVHMRPICKRKCRDWTDIRKGASQDKRCCSCSPFANGRTDVRTTWLKLTNDKPSSVVAFARSFEAEEPHERPRDWPWRSGFGEFFGLGFWSRKYGLFDLPTRPSVRSLAGSFVRSYPGFPFAAVNSIASATCLCAFPLHGPTQTR